MAISAGTATLPAGPRRFSAFISWSIFVSPICRRRLQDFWRRWHISLSTWLRDYLYISLGGNRKGESPHHVEPFDHHAAGRALARRQLDICDLGRHPWRSALPSSGCWELRRTGRAGFSWALGAPDLHFPRRLLFLDILPGRIVRCSVGVHSGLASLELAAVLSRCGEIPDCLLPPAVHAGSLSRGHGR